MDNSIEITCDSCGATVAVTVSEDADDHATVRCGSCGATVTTVGKLHATMAQEAIGLGAGELDDDHVPRGGPPFGETT